MRTHIDSYSFGHMTVEGQDYDNDLIIFPDKVEANWWRDEGHALKITDMQDVINYKPDLLIVGTGDLARMKIEPSVKQRLEQESIKLIADHTKAAVKWFNEIWTEGKIVGAFHLTC